MRVVYSPRAVRDLIDIGSYLSERSPLGALAVEQRIRTVIALIASYPSCGRLVTARPAVSVMPVGRFPYLIFYRASGDELSILHIRHAARVGIDPDEL